MQTSSERRRLAQIYHYESTSPGSLLARCASGLGMVGILAYAGSTMNSDDRVLADRIESEHARVAVAQAAAEHERVVFANRQAQFNSRFLTRATYVSVSQAPHGPH